MSSYEGEASDTGTLSHSLSLAELGGAIRRARLLILVCILVCELGATLFLMTARATYPTEMTLAPQQATQQGSSSGGGLGSLGGGLGAAAGLLGLDKSGSSGDFEKFRTIYISPQTAEMLDQRFHVMRRLFPGWNDAAQRWEMPHLTLLNAPQRLVRWIFGRPVWRAPEADDLSALLSNKFTVAKLEESPFVSVKATAADPANTEALMVALVDAANDILRRNAQQQAQVQIRYLTRELQTVDNAEHRQVLTQLLSSQEQTLMLSNSNLPYAAQILIAPTTHYDQAKPGIMTTLLLAAIAGMVFGILICFVREASARGRGEEARDFGEVLRAWRYSLRR